MTVHLIREASLDDIKTSSVASVLIKLARRIIVWFNQYMTMILVALGSSLIGGAMFLLGKGADSATVDSTWWYRSAFIALFVSGLAWAIALFREWKRESKLAKSSTDREERDNNREKRDIARFEEEKKLWTNVQMFDLKTTDETGHQH